MQIRTKKIYLYSQRDDSVEPSSRAFKAIEIAIREVFSDSHILSKKKFNIFNSSVCLYRPELYFLYALIMWLFGNKIYIFFPENFCLRYRLYAAYKESNAIKQKISSTVLNFKYAILMRIANCIYTPDLSIVESSPQKTRFVDYSFSSIALNRNCISQKEIKSKSFPVFGYILGFTNVQNYDGIISLSNSIGNTFTRSLIVCGKPLECEHFNSTQYKTMDVFYRSVDCLIVHLPYYSGVITKVVEALTYCCPVIIVNYAPIPAVFNYSCGVFTVSLDKFKELALDRDNTEVLVRRLIANARTVGRSQAHMYINEQEDLLKKYLSLDAQ